MKKMLFQNDSLWMWMSLAAIALIALMQLCNMSLSHTLRHERNLNEIQRAQDAAMIEKLLKGNP